MLILIDTEKYLTKSNPIQNSQGSLLWDLIVLTTPSGTFPIFDTPLCRTNASHISFGEARDQILKEIHGQKCDKSNVVYCFLVTIYCFQATILKMYFLIKKIVLF